ncbi:gluconokinase [Haloferula sp.]|uniref:gluconokinase n=1 Tax=Haloferula sp. TaxID=2497595 RepID=UPI00329C79D5
MQSTPTDSKKVIVAGVSGSGKTTIGLELARMLDAEFLDGDDYHRPESVAKMAGGEALTDEDRAGWLTELGETMSNRHCPTVLACSALKKIYRDRLRELCDGLSFVLLTADTAEIRERMKERGKDDGHFMPPALLDSQLATLETGDDMIVVENVGPPEEVAARIFKLI